MSWKLFILDTIPRKRLDSDLMLPYTVTNNNPSHQEDSISIKSHQQQQQQLDRFGLHIQTAENFFPPLPPETEIIGIVNPAQQQQQMNNNTIQVIRQAMKDHIPINFKIFDEYGIEKKVSSSPDAFA